jgi:hypothetical protein
MANVEDYRTTAKAFHDKLVDKLSRYEIDVMKIDTGFGYFKGSIPSSMSKMFIQHNGVYLVCPSFDAMKEYLQS